MHKLCMHLLFSILGFSLLACKQTNPPILPSPSVNAAPIEIKMVVVTMFEIGQDEGDKPGEFQLWKERQQLSTRFPFPASHHDIFVNEQTGVLGIVTGMGTAKATAAIMALGLDPRFDLRHAYWLVAGIAGVDPEDASIGSAVWAKWLVDGDLAHQIDAREIPQDWPSAYFPLFENKPVGKRQVVNKQAIENSHSSNGEVYKLNHELSDWAFALSKHTKLLDLPAMQTLRSHYKNYPQAQRPPFVLQGDQLAASTFWHGSLLNDWANDWTYYWTGGEGNFVTSGMEDTGSYQAILYLDAAKRADKDRFMVLRTASNYSMPYTGLSAADNLAAESGEAGFAGMESALESAYRVGSVVVDEIVNNWAVYKNTLPHTQN